MTIHQRIRSLLVGLFMAGCAVFFLLYEDSETSSVLVAAFLSISLVLYGLRHLFFYFTSARFMVSGMIILYVGLITFDVGLFALSIIDDPNILVMIYLVGLYGFTGVIGVLRAFEAKGENSPWISTFLHGAFDILIAIICLIFMHDADVLVLAYSIGLLHKAIVRIYTAVRPHDIAYIP